MSTKAPAAAAVTTDSEVRCSTTPAGLGSITLCRERQLNALGAEHVEAIRQQLLAWSEPGSGVQCVLLDSNNDRSFCSGGDAHLGHALLPAWQRRMLST
jgi:enoyl-CoA hydratase/carnithine racemase